MQLTKAELLNAYRIMKMIREFGERIHVEFATGEIPGFVHLYAGEEAIATGVCMHLDDRDKITSTHRGRGHCLAKGCDVYGMRAEIYGKKNGLCGGKGGSMHIADLSKAAQNRRSILSGRTPSPRAAQTVRQPDRTCSCGLGCRGSDLAFVSCSGFAG